MVYLDYAATTPIPKAVADSMYKVLCDQFGNPSAQYAIGLGMKKEVDRWREIIAAALDCDTERLFFTSCGTESDNWAISAACWQNRHIGKHIVTTAVEHSAILEPCKWMEREGYEVTYISPEKNGEIKVKDVLNAVRPDTALVSVMLVNNELGNRYPVEEIAKQLHAKNPDTLFHTDATQAFFKIPFSARKLGADLISISAHKIGGAKGIGALYIGSRLRNPRPLLAGGGQEKGLRSGTEATAQIAGFAKAVELRQAIFQESLSHMERIRAYAIQRLSDIPDLVFLGAAEDNTPYAPHILSAALVGWPSENIIRDLSEQEIYISSGSACRRGKPSHVIATLKLPRQVERSAIRLSFGTETTKEEIDICADALCRHHDTRFPML